MYKGDREKQYAARSGCFIEYVLNKVERSKYTFRIEGTGERYYIVGDSKVSESDFNKMFPIGLISKTRHEHIDNRTNFYN